MSQQKQSHPDSHLQPEATGLAKTTVEAHAKEQPLKFYAGWFCPFVQRAWLILEEKKIQYQYIEVNPYHKPKSLLDLNPRGLVPTLAYNDRPLYESTVLCEFLEDAFPDSTPKVFPEDPYERARTRIWVDFVTSRIIPAFHRFLQYQPLKGESEQQAKDGENVVRQEFLGKLKEFTREMDKEGPYFWGKEPKMVDFAIAPWAVRLWVFDYFKSGLGIPEEGQGGDDEGAWARWRKWLNAMEERDSVKATTSEKQYFVPIYQRYADNTAQSKLAKATRSGRGVP
ncbi:hypothetical protein B0A49_01493 [Cryomyces minteri]|uniref:Glutathione S-transferase omega-1 n=1 Tax=Cryomyces minteri TaxID=331657 RepID=A0A4U0XS12_9PEZI|nr:hypothetical protein B0A49_01493 [Cryomyces minteri]